MTKKMKNIDTIFRTFLRLLKYQNPLSSTSLNGTVFCSLISSGDLPHNTYRACSDRSLPDYF